MSSRIRKPRPFLASAAVILAAACGASPKSRASPTPAPVSGPRAVMPSGTVYRLEVARTPEEQAEGLMYRESLLPRAGMLFLFGDRGVHSFYMKNTMIPLDIIWMDDSGRVLFVSANTPPCRSDPCPTYGPQEAAPVVLEIAGGMSAKEGVKVGSRIELLDVAKD